MPLSRQGVSLSIWFVVFTIVITIVVVLRFQAARIKRRALRPDDYLIVVAYISTLALEGSTLWGIINGLGSHSSELSNYEIGVQYKVFLGAGLTWVVATVFCKLSILWLYTCIFTTKGFKIAARTAMCIVSAYGVAFFCVFFTNCQSLSHPWNPHPGGHCRAVSLEEIVSVSVNMAIDTFIAILPMQPLWMLQMRTRKKFAISCLFGLGLLIVGISGWRTQIIVQSVTQIDFVYGLGQLTLVFILEVWLGIVVACLPTLPPIFSKYIDPIVSRISGLPRKNNGQRQLKEAKNSIGGSGPRGFNKKSYSRLDSDSLIELDYGRSFRKAEVMALSASNVREEPESLISNLDVIHVRQDFQLHSEPC